MGQLGVRRRRTHGRERRRGFYPPREVANESLHGRMPKAVETKKIHLLEGLLGGPFFEGHAIGGNEDAGAVISEAAVHKYFFFGIIAEQRKESNHLLIRGRGPSADRYMDEAHAQGFDPPAFPVYGPEIIAAKIDHRSDTEFAEFGQAFGSRLCAAIKMVIDSAGIGKAGEAKFFCVGRTHRRRRERLRTDLGGKWVREKRRAHKKEKERRVFHFGYDAGILARDGTK